MRNNGPGAGFESAVSSDNDVINSTPNRSRDREKRMKKKAEKKKDEEKERLEHIAGYDRNFDPIAEAADLKIEERRRRISKK
jgi:hypothetical protein